MTVAAGPASRGPRLVRPQPRAALVIEPDVDQQAVIDHRKGPLLVLAGPGTGKTATIVELVADRVERDGLRPEQILVLTFSRRAADELRSRLAGRLQARSANRRGRAVAGRLAWTFHAWCYAVLRRHDPTIRGAPLQLLSGPEQDAVVRELLWPQGGGPGEEQRWPPEWLPLLQLRGFADEVRALLARCQERGIDPGDLAELGQASGHPQWRDLAPFYGDYLANLDWQGAVDYSGLVQRTARVLTSPEVIADVASHLRLVIVDEYQDTDPAQEQVLGALTAAGVQLIAVGDPDQSIYAFRGADVSGILDFAERFRGPRGRPARVLSLRRCRRSGAELLAASRSVASGLPLPGLPADLAGSHRELEALGPGDGGEGHPAVSVRLFPSAAQEAVAVADVLRRAHLIDGVPWSQMAVLVRSTSAAGPLQRALADAGVPVETPVDERPLVREPLLAPLLTLLRIGAGLCPLDEPTAGQLLRSPLGGADALDIRRLRRALHHAERAAGGGRRSGELLVDFLQAAPESAGVEQLPDDVAGPPLQIAALLHLVRTGVAEGVSPEQVMWSVWTASRWRRELERAVSNPAATTPAMLRHADRQLQAVVGLFDAASRFTDRLPAAGLPVFLESLLRQEIPADSMNQRGLGSEAVRLITAHRSKGLEWDLVVVAGVQDGGWPFLRSRGTLLESDAIAEADSEPTLFARDELAAAARASALVDERRLFYVAITRARRRLLVTAVSGSDDGELRPSRFLDELGVTVPAQPEPAPRLLSAPALVAELRCFASDPEAAPGVRAAAVAQLAELAPHVPAAHPDRWWGLADWTQREEPLLDAGMITLSPSQVEAIRTCPLRWFLVRRAGVTSSSTSSQGFGTLMHDLARHVVDSGITSPQELAKRLDVHWPQIDWEAPWYSARERRAAQAALTKLLDWHRSRPNTVVGAELDFDLDVALAAGTARIRGQIDRLERDPQGRGFVVDYKSGRQGATEKMAKDSPQLGLYQLAVMSGTVASGDGAALAGTSGAALMPLRKGNERKQPALEVGDDGRTWVHELLEGLVSAIAAEDFPARPGDGCETCPVRRCCPARPEGAQVV